MEAERQAMNTPVQGSAADLIKKAMIDLHRELRKRRLTSRLILQIHDELLLEVPEEEAETARALVKEIMEGALRSTSRWWRTPGSARAGRRCTRATAADASPPGR